MLKLEEQEHRLQKCINCGKTQHSNFYLIAGYKMDPSVPGVSVIYKSLPSSLNSAIQLNQWLSWGVNLVSTMRLALLHILLV